MFNDVNTSSNRFAPIIIEYTAHIIYSFPNKTGAAALKYTLPLVTVTNALANSISKLGPNIHANPSLTTPSTTLPAPPTPKTPRYFVHATLSNPTPSGTNNINVILTMVNAALIFPCIPTFTLSLAPLCAIHSLRALTPTSRAMITAVGMATMPPYLPARTISAVDTINLSATGSKNAPNGEVTSHLLARNPSNQSVILATAKRRLSTGARLGMMTG
mmetsp:Transcript_11952/g.24084  ORF Transcript_11952/g.24084 Transcript_11952/m.24084 type:complete len:217 (-) Transcript_11952:531-1181(-)